MTVDLDDDIILSGEPFKAGGLFFRAVCDKPGAIRLTWGSTTEWADWDPLDFAIVPASETPAIILRVTAGEFEGD